MMTTTHPVMSIRRRTPLVAYHILIAFLLLVEGSIAREAPFMLSTVSSSRVLQLQSARTTNSLHGKASRSRSNDEITNLVRSSSSRRRTSESASCGGRTGCVGDVGVVHAGIRHDDESSTTPRIKNDSPLGSLLKMRGGASSSSHRGNNAVQGVLKSILASPSLPSPIKQLIEMICGFIENLTDWKVLPRLEEDRKSKSKKTKPRREKFLVDGVSIGGGTRKTRIPKNRGGGKAEDESEEVETVVHAKKRRKRSSKVESASEKPAVAILERATPAASAEVAATAPKQNPPTPSRATADAASKKFLSNSLKSSNPNYRIQRELKEFLSSPPPGLSVKISGKNMRLWIVTLDMP
jgi:hypothetical protein